MKFASECYTSIMVRNKITNFTIKCFQDNDKKIYLAIIYGKIINKKNVLLGLQYDCILGHNLMSIDCDCNYQYQRALEMIVDQGSGVLIYSCNQTGRNIGIIDHIKSLNVQQQFNLDTINSNKFLGLKTDNRDFSRIKLIIDALKIKSIKLISNNPEKIKALREYITEVINFNYDNITLSDMGKDYLFTKKNSLNHSINTSNSNHFILDKKNNLEQYNKIFEKKKIVIIQSLWHNKFLDPMVQNIKEELIINGILNSNIEIYYVPGAWEIPFKISQIDNKNCDAIICCNFFQTNNESNFLLNAVSNKLMDLQIKKQIPILYFLTHGDKHELSYEEKNDERVNDLVYSTLYMLLKL